MIEGTIVVDASGTRAYLETSEGVYVCSEIVFAFVGDALKPDSVKLTGIGKTRSLDEAQMWLHFGIEPNELF
jgi:hypothetical protein